MARLHAFATLELTGPDGHPLARVLSQPKRTALLCYLAFGRAGALHRRDTLLGLFWPEMDESRARNALNTSLSFLRRSLEPDTIVVRGAEEMGVDPASLWCDVRAFEEALDAGDPSAALELYRGDLLPGFFVTGAPEVERWLDEERRRLRRRAADGAGRLVRECLDGEDPEAALGPARRLVELSPLDERASRWLMETLAALGDGAGALQELRRLEETLDRELGAAPSPETLTWVRGLRARELPTPAARMPVGRPTASPAPGVAAVATAPDISPRPLAGPSRRPRVRVVAAAVVAALLTSTVFLRLRAEPGGEGGVGPAADEAVSLAVFPLEAPDEGEGAAAVTATRLLVASLQVPEVVTAAWAEVEASPPTEGPVVRGGLLRGGDRITVSASLHGPDGRTRASSVVTVAGGDGLAAAVERIALALLPGAAAPVLAGHAPDLTAETTSLAALRAYVRGAGRYREGRYVEAAEAFTNAVRKDPAFGAAHYRRILAVAEGTAGGLEEAVEEAVALKEGFHPRSRLLVEAKHAEWVESRPEAAERRLRQAWDLYPGDPEVAYELGDLLFHNGHWGTPPEDVRYFLERALDADSGHVDAMVHLARVAQHQGRPEEVLVLADRLERSPQAQVLDAEIAAFRADAGRLRAVEGLARSLGRSTDWSAAYRAMTAATYAGDPSAVLPAVRALTRPDRPDALRVEGHVLTAFLEAGRGRWRAAVEEAARTEALDPTAGAAVRGWIAATAPPGAPVRLREALDALEAVIPAQPASWSPGSLVGRLVSEESLRTVAALLALEVGEEAVAAEHREALGRGGHAGAAGVVEAALLRRAGEPDEALRVLAGSARTPGSITAALTILLHGKLSEEAARPEGALRWYRAFAPSTDLGMLVRGPALQGEARVLAASGRPEEARVVRERLARLWRAADPEVLQVDRPTSPST